MESGGKLPRSITNFQFPPSHQAWCSHIPRSLAPPRLLQLPSLPGRGGTTEVTRESTPSSTAFVIQWIPSRGACLGPNERTPARGRIYCFHLRPVSIPLWRMRALTSGHGIITLIPFHNSEKNLFKNERIPSSRTPSLCHRRTLNGDGRMPKG